MSFVISSQFGYEFCQKQNFYLQFYISLIITVGHRRQVTAVTRLPRWQRHKTWLQVRLLLTMLQDMDPCKFLACKQVLHSTNLWYSNLWSLRIRMVYCGTCIFPAGGGWLDQKRWVTEGSEGGNSHFRLTFRELVFRCNSSSSRGFIDNQE